VLGVPGALPHVGEHRVVRIGVLAEVFLNDRERRVEQAFAREHQRPQRTRHPAIAVRERMDRHEVQVRERSANHDRQIRRRVQRGHRLGDEPGTWSAGGAS
jgi:hypothetical protein